MVVVYIVTQHYLMLKRKGVIHSHRARKKVVCAGGQSPGDRHGGEEQQGGSSLHGTGMAIEVTILIVR